MNVSCYARTEHHPPALGSVKAPAPAAAWVDQQEFVDSIEPLLPSVLRSARRILGCDDLARDALQEALVSLWSHGRPSIDLRGWLIRTVQHRSLHSRRSLSRRRNHERDAGGRCACIGHAVDPVRRLDRLKLRARICASVVALPADQRAVFIMREIEGQSYESIALQLAVPVGTVRSRLHRARSALRRQLTEAS